MNRQSNPVADRAQTGLNLVIVLLLAVLAIASRGLIETPNFKPVSAVCIWAPLLMIGKTRLVWWLPLLIVAGSELCLSPGAGWLLVPLALSWTVSLAIGQTLRGRVFGCAGSSGATVGGAVCWLVIAALVASIQFYAITNFAVWLGTGWYAKSVGGLTQCMAAGIPFLRWTLQADLIFTLAPLPMAWAIKGSGQLVAAWRSRRLARAVGGRGI